MKKMPTIFVRDPNDRSKLTEEHHPDCAWVFMGEGRAVKKYDGSCCRILDGALWKRREVKKGKAYPEGFELVDTDEVTGKVVGWVPITDSPEDRWHREALMRESSKLPNGTYELCGPKVQNNPEELDVHTLIPHLDATTYIVERTYYGLRVFIEKYDIEGIIFRHPSGAFAKVKGRDFGIVRGVKV